MGDKEWFFKQGNGSNVESYVEWGCEWLCLFQWWMKLEAEQVTRDSRAAVDYSDTIISFLGSWRMTMIRLWHVKVSICMYSHDTQSISYTKSGGCGGGLGVVCEDSRVECMKASGSRSQL